MPLRREIIRTTVQARKPPAPSDPNRPQLIIVSNREPYEHRARKGHLLCQRTDGGVTSALDPVLRRCGGVWVAWGGGEA
ncbi:MAG: hypothetical protein C4293_19350, partial [Nitrospiraceae bacterium]